MLTTFPKPYPDELLYSLFSRYHVRAGNTSASMTSEDLFGKRKVRSVWDLPSNLQTFTKRVGGIWKAEKLIADHTMYNYYAPFLKHSQAYKVKEFMMGSEGNLIHVQTGLTKTKVSGKMHMWICEDCISEDLERYGETYWHRLHQAPGVFICPYHGGFLKETNIPLRSENITAYYLAAPDLKRYEMNLHGLIQEDFKMLKKIARMTELLLNNSFVLPDDGTIRQKYIANLEKKGYVTWQRKVKAKELYQGFHSNYSDCFLDIMQSSLTVSNSDWLRKICQKHRNSFHPIRHVLLLLFLDMNLEDLFSEKPKQMLVERNNEKSLKEIVGSSKYLPFGQGPWPCLNRSCPLFGKLVISHSKVVVNSKTKNPVGTFACKCGFIYARSGPDTSEEAKYKIGKVKNYGQVWEEKLVKLIKNGNSLVSIEKELDVCSATIKKYACCLGIETPWSKILTLPKYSDSRKKVRKLEEYKEVYLQLKHDHPNRSRSELSTISPKVHSYLRKYDNEWLKDNFPPKQKALIITERIDWKQRDKELLQQMKDVLKDWEKDENGVKRKTRTAIGKRMKKSDVIAKSLHRLPETKKYLEEVTEDYETFKLRKIDRICEQYKKIWKPLTISEIYRKVGYVGIYESTKIIISAKVREHNMEIR